MTRARRFAILGLVLTLFAAALMLKHFRSDQGAAEAGRDEVAVGSTSLPRLVDLGSDKCVPCKMMAPILEGLKREYNGRMAVEVIDVRKDRSAGIEYGVRIIPTQVFFSADGREVFRHEGFMSRDDILSKWKELGIDVEPGHSGKREG